MELGHSDANKKDGSVKAITTNTASDNKTTEECKDCAS